MAYEWGMNRHPSTRSVRSDFIISTLPKRPATGYLHGRNLTRNKGKFVQRVISFRYSRRNRPTAGSFRRRLWRRDVAALDSFACHPTSSIGIGMAGKRTDVGQRDYRTLGHFFHGKSRDNRQSASTDDIPRDLGPVPFLPQSPERFARCALSRPFAED